MNNFTRRSLLSAVAAIGVFAGTVGMGLAADKIQLRLATSGSETGQRALAMTEAFGPAVADFADYLPGYNGSMFAQGTELEAISRGNLEMAFMSAQEAAQFFPEFSIFSAGYVMQDAAHQVAVFNDSVMDQFKQKLEDKLGIKMLATMYFGRRQLNLRQSKDELTVSTPADIANVNLRMPGTEAWQFLGKALGAAPTPMAFAEVYTGLSTGAIDGQDNPLPTVVDKKFYEVTKQIVLTSHLVDQSFIVISKSVWDDMSAEQQEGVQAGATAAAARCRELVETAEAELVSFLEEQGLDVYEPDVAAFRKHAQDLYLASEYAASWPEGALDRINELGN